MARGVGGHSPANVAKYLSGIDFPATLSDLQSKAEENDAPKEVMEVIDQLPDQEYGSMADMMSGIGEVE